MKTATGLRPVIQAPTAFPKMERDPFRLVVDDAPVVLTAMRAIHLWPVHYVTPVDTTDRPAGTVMHVAHYTTEPHVEVREVVASIPDEVKDAAEEHLRHRLGSEGAPADAVRRETRRASRMFTQVSITWYEVTA